MLVKGVWGNLVHILQLLWRDSHLQCDMARFCTPVSSLRSELFAQKVPYFLGGFQVAFNGLSWGTENRVLGTY